MELLLQSFIFCHYRNLSFQVTMNGSISEIRRADEREAGKVAPCQVQPEPCRRRRKRGRQRKRAGEPHTTASPQRSEFNTLDYSARSVRTQSGQSSTACKSGYPCTARVSRAVRS